MCSFTLPDTLVCSCIAHLRWFPMTRSQTAIVNDTCTVLRQVKQCDRIVNKCNGFVYVMCFTQKCLKHLMTVASEGNMRFPTANKPH